MEVRFYKYIGARNVLDKALPEPVVKNGSVLNFDYRSPVLVTRGDVSGLTMCYVPSLKRYYFIDNVSYDGDKANLLLSCDVLMTFADKIKNATGTVFSTNNPRKYDDDYRPVCDVRTTKERIDFPSDLLTEDGSIVMITIKGNK